MARALPGGGVGFWLSAEEIEPTGDPAWLYASASLRRAFWGAALRLAEERWDESRSAGLDRHGAPLAALRARTIRHRRSAMGPASPSAPPLTPAYSLSRTRSYLQSRYVPGRGGYFSWRYDARTGASWGRILQYHATGMVPHAPVRDVIGFSPAEIADVRATMRDWWESHRHDAVVVADRVPRPVPPGRRGPLPWARPAKTVRVRDASGREFFQFRGGGRGRD